MSMSTTQQVIFKIDNEEYGLNIMKVFGIEKFQEVVKVPNTPPYIEGIINLRGEVLPIYNLRKKFNLAKKDIDNDTKIIVTHANNTHIGFIVDSVAEILYIDDEIVESAPSIITGVDRKYIESVAKLENRMVIILDIDKILNDEEHIEINNVKENSCVPS